MGFFKQFREAFWNIPELLFGKKGFILKSFKIYLLFRPFSHVLLFTVLSLIFSVYTIFGSVSSYFIDRDVLIEGVVVGDSGLSRINPLLPTNNQLETDISSLIYYGLFHVSFEGLVEPVLAQEIYQIDNEGLNFNVKLRKDVYWHNGEIFTANDVIKNFDFLKALESTGEPGLMSRYSKAARNLTVTKLGDFEISLKLEKVNPSLYEDISFGLLPSSILENIYLSNFTRDKFNLNPIGTGPFIFESFSKELITFTANAKFFLGKPAIKKYIIKLFSDADSAVFAIKNGDIHILADSSTKIVEDLSKVQSIKFIESKPIYTRYWGIYFNLQENGPKQFKEKKVRKAIATAINKEEIKKKVKTVAELANGSIPPVSWAYNANIDIYEFNIYKASKLLDEAGWIQKEIDGKKFRFKDEEVLRFDLSYLNNPERTIVAEQIRDDLEKIGIVVNLDPRTSADLNDNLVVTRNFDALLYGVETSIDPDRYNLWHSSAIDYPGLNIASYQSSVKGAIIDANREIERKSLSDFALENGLRSNEKEKRLGTNTGTSIGYLKFQEILTDECPMIFLYYPKFIYSVRNRVENIDLSNMILPSDRYLSIWRWQIRSLDKN